ncbi:MAG: hypothetical protein H0U74_07955 [Bradymonadaceae bacterium]|nr:hypothetical protein [Lujinxingiaceae bacterium]
MLPNVLWFDQVNRDDVGVVVGKNASLGEMFQKLAGQGVSVPDGFATTAAAYRGFLESNDLVAPFSGHLRALRTGEASLHEVGKRIRRLIARAKFPAELGRAIEQAYGELGRRYDVDAADVAVHSSATAEDLPEASFAGQQESFLNIQGTDELLEACRRCYAGCSPTRRFARSLTSAPARRPKSSFMPAAAEGI